MLEKAVKTRLGKNIFQKKLDQKLVFSLGNTKKIPSLSQFKMIKKILTPQEKKTIGLLFILIVAAFFVIGGDIYLRHRVTIPKYGGEYTEGLIGYPNAINPLFTQLNSVDADLARLIYAGLFRYDEAMELKPDLAESYTIGKDGKIITIKLKPNLKWSDGEPLTIDDVIFTFNSISAPETQSPLWVSFQGVIFNKINDQTFSIELPKPFAPFLRLLTTGIIPEHLWQEIPAKNIRFSSFNLKPIGAGPYMFESFAKDSKGNLKSYTLKINPEYNLNKPYIKNFTFKFFNDTESAFDALRNHQINGLSFINKEQKEKLNRKSITVIPLRVPYFTAMFFNEKANLLLRGKPLRESLALSVDKNEIINVAIKGEASPVAGPIMPGQIGFTRDFKLIFDPEAARKKLENDGWKKISREEFIEKRKKEIYQAWLDERKAKTAPIDKSKKPPKLTPQEEASAKKEAEDFLAKTTDDLQKIDERQKVYRQKNNYGLTLKITTINQPEFMQTASLIKSNWQDLGAQVEIEAVDNEGLKEIIKSRRYEILLYGVLVGADPDPFPFWHSSQLNYPGLNLSGFTSRQADDYLEKGRETYNEETRKKNYYDFQKLLATELPAIFLYSSNYLYPMETFVMGFRQYKIFEPADRFNGVINWYLRTKNEWQWK